MHAWILLLAVLATSNHTVQVASTTDILSSTNTISKTIFEKILNPVINLVPFTTEQQQHKERSHYKQHKQESQRLLTTPSAPNKIVNEQVFSKYNNEIISEDDITPTLSSMFNTERSPVIDRSTIANSEDMKQFYNQKDEDLESIKIPQRGGINVNTRSANIVRRFSHQDSKIDDRFPHHHRKRLYFDIKDIPADEKLKAAELQLTCDITDHAVFKHSKWNHTRYQVLVYDITWLRVRGGKRVPNYLLLDTKTIRLNSTVIVSLDVKHAVSRWLDSPKKNFGLLVEVRTMRALKLTPHHHVRLRRSTDESHINWQQKQPLLLAYTDDENKNNLLEMLNIKRPPIIDRSKILIPEAMVQLYKLQEGHDLNSVHIPPRGGVQTKSANTVRSFLHKDSKIDNRFPHHHRSRLHFDIKSIPAEEKLKAAELLLTRDVISHAALKPNEWNRTRYQVLVYDITWLRVRGGKRVPNYLLLDSKTIHLNTTDTISLDVQPAVDRWLESPKKNFGLLVEVLTMRALKPAPHHHVRLRRSTDEPHMNWQRKQPLLMAYTDDGQHEARPIRDISKRLKSERRKRKKTEDNCRRHDLYVDFSKVGWSNWIVAPNGYDAYLCQGTCKFPLADHLNPTNHAVIQTLVNNVNPAKVPKACCVPTELLSISILYLGSNNEVIHKNYKEMTVGSCGCR